MGAAGNSQDDDDGENLEKSVERKEKKIPFFRVTYKDLHDCNLLLLVLNKLQKSAPTPFIVKLGLIINSYVAVFITIIKSHGDYRSNWVKI